MRTNLPSYNVSLVGGLGNQLFQYANALSYLPYGDLGLMLHTDKPNQSSGLNGDLTSLTLQNYTKIENFGKHKWILKYIHNPILRLSTSTEKFGNGAVLGSAAQKVLISIFSLIHLGHFGVISQPSIGYSKKLKINGGKKLLQIGYFQHSTWRDNEIVVGRLRSLNLKNPSNAYKEFVNSMNSKKILVIHMRFGDFLSERDFGVPSKEYFRKAIELHYSINEYDQVLIFTNERVKAEEYIKDLGHLNFKMIHEKSGFSPCENLYLMRLGSGYVISNSTFSWWGAFLSLKANPLVVCPQTWFSGLAEPKNLVPPTWVRMAN